MGTIKEKEPETMTIEEKRGEIFDRMANQIDKQKVKIEHQAEEIRQLRQEHTVRLR